MQMRFTMTTSRFELAWPFRNLLRAGRHRHAATEGHSRLLSGSQAWTWDEAQRIPAEARLALVAHEGHSVVLISPAVDPNRPIARAQAGGTPPLGVDPELRLGARHRAKGAAIVEHF